MSTLAEVANAAGVSPSTVSHVINGTRRVSEATERAVREAIDVLGYRPNAVARSLARASTKAVGVAQALARRLLFPLALTCLDQMIRGHGAIDATGGAATPPRAGGERAAARRDGGDAWRR